MAVIEEILNNHALRPLLRLVAAVILLPLISGLGFLLFPVKSLREKSEGQVADLWRRNNWIDRIACGICLSAFIGAVLPYFGILESDDPLGVGLGFGLGVIGPLIWIATLTLPSGTDRFREFWRFYQLKYEINWVGLCAIFTPFILIGIFAFFELVRRVIKQVSESW